MKNVSNNAPAIQQQHNEHRLPTIVVPLDGSAAATSALPVARALALLKGMPLNIIHVSGRTLPAAELIERLRLTSEELHGTIVNQSTGSPAEAIVAQAAEWSCTMLVMNARTGTEHPEGELGSVAREVMLASTCPVVLVDPDRGGAPWELRRLLLPYDGTPTSAFALGPAAELASMAGAELHILHVPPADAARPDEPGTLSMPRYVDQPHHEWPFWSHELLDRLRALGHPPTTLPIHLFFEEGDVGETIVRFGKKREADLIALAWRGRLDPERAMTIREVIRDATSPVILFRVEEVSC